MTKWSALEQELSLIHISIQSDKNTVEEEKADEEVLQGNSVEHETENEPVVNSVGQNDEESYACLLYTSAVKDDLIRNNNTINWIPESIGKGRFGAWLENVQDWGISRNRYWGCLLYTSRCV